MLLVFLFLCSFFSSKQHCHRHVPFGTPRESKAGSTRGPAWWTTWAARSYRCLPPPAPQLGRCLAESKSWTGGRVPLWPMDLWTSTFSLTACRGANSNQGFLHFLLRNHEKWSVSITVNLSCFEEEIQCPPQIDQPQSDECRFGGQCLIHWKVAISEPQPSP